MKIRKAKPGAKGPMRSWEAPISIVKDDIYVAGRVPCASCGKLHQVVLLYPWDKRSAAHLEPIMGRRSMADGDFVATEGHPDTLWPLCAPCFEREGRAVLKWKRANLEERARLEKEALQDRLRKLTRKRDQEQRAIEEEIATVEADLQELLGGGA